MGYSRGNVTKYENCIAKNVEIFTHGAASYRVGGLIGYIEADGAAANTATATLKGCKVGEGLYSGILRVWRVGRFHV